MTGSKLDLVDRVRARLADQPSMSEKSMFGGRSFMVNGAMVVSARANGDLLVRVDPDRSVELQSRSGASQAEMGTGRTMGPGWTTVTADAVRTEKQLAFWLGVALAYNRSVTGRD